MQPSMHSPVAINGEIVLGYRQEGAGWRLWVQDDGTGLPTSTENLAEGSFGRQLLDTLTLRLNAQIVCSGNAGTRVDVFSGVMA